ncbi:MAG: 50S ribosomal protein L17 [Puniceicoccaceae bacterium]|nr:MAG: 50S ribosomal protein L17 [Puniceicoccaceae bacterium]
MRHGNRKHKLGVSGPHRSAMMGNLSVALIQHGRIETTLSKARALRPFIEKIITLAKKAEKANDAARKLHFRRLAIARVRDKQAVAKLFDELVSEFTERNGGYTRIYKLGQRIGDAAEMALIEFVDGNDEGYNAKPKKKATKKAAKKSAKKKAAKKAVAKDAADEATEAEVEEAVEAEVETSAEEPAKAEAEEAAEPEAEEAPESEPEADKKKDA